MRSIALGLFALALAAAGPLNAETADVPPPLEGWKAWVLDGHEYVGCPYVDGGDATQAGAHVCTWPGPLDIQATRDSARLAMRLRVYSRGWVPLPGDADHWPQDVTVNRTAKPVVDHDGQPQLLLEPGEYEIAATIPWTSMPDSLSVPQSIGIVRVSVDGRRIDLPERSGQIVRLGAARIVTEANQLDVQIYRKLTDSVPGLLRTRVMLQVSGEAREIVVGPLLPAGFAPMQLASTLPARLDPDGRLRVQVRAGSWSLELLAHAASALEEIALPDGSSPEVWSFEPVDRLRSSAVEGAAAIDPSQANVPGEWQGLPAYRLEPGGKLRVVERSRGINGQDLDRVVVERDLWWDFAGSGYTFRDQLSGRLQQRWRLDMAEPFTLQGARSNGQPLLVTAGRDGRTGVEVRTPTLGLEATGRIDGAKRKLAATGWDRHVEALGINLHLPPGHRLVAALGTDESSQSWLERWRLLDMFVVLLVTAVAFRVAGVRIAAIALAGLVLAHQEWHVLTWATLNLLIAIALVRAAPAGRLRSLAQIWRAAGLAIVAVLFVPFALAQARLAFFPQLENRGLVPYGAPVAQAPAADMAAPPEVAAEREAAVNAALQAKSEMITVTATRKQAATSGAMPLEAPSGYLQRYASDVQLQNGPGVPRWQFQSYRLQWNGPVEPTQSLRLVVLTPAWVSLWRLAAIALLAVLFASLARGAFPSSRPPWINRWFGRHGGAPAATTTAILVVLTALLAAIPHSASAEVPSKDLLDELARRLSRPPECAPSCVNVASAFVSVDGDRMTVRLEAHAGARAVLSLPQAPQRWAPDAVTVDGSAARGQAQTARGLSVPVESGVHDVEVSGRIVAADAIRLAFPSRPARVTVSAPGWNVSGIEQGRMLGDGLSLIRKRTQSATGDGKSLAEEFPPYVRVTRTLNLDLDWRVQVDVQRLAPAQGAFVIEVPLLAGESVLTAGLPVRDGHVVVSMPAGAQNVGWVSNVARAETLKLSSPRDASWVEVWRIAAGPIWHVEYSGTPQVFEDESAEPSWVQYFEPRPGETLELAITRPAGVEGATFAFESVNHQVQVGQRAIDTTLNLSYRSTQGGRHVIKLPDGARLQHAQSDGQAITLDERNGEVALPLQPGEHMLELAWQLDSGARIATRPSAVDLRAPSSNVSTQVNMPQSRWILFARGGGVGPAILYWAELVVFIVIAVLMGRHVKSPLTTREWLLVGLGLSTFSWSVLLLFAAWVFALEWRRRWHGNVEPWVFNGVQVALAVLTVAALGSLVAAIPNGLLGQPDMRIEDPMFQPSALNWFHDRVDAVLPQPIVISVSLWYYKAAMLAWALWLSFALVRWVRWAWEAYGATRIWNRDLRGRRGSQLSGSPSEPPAPQPGS